MNFQHLPDEIHIQILELVHDSYKSSAAFIELRIVSKIFNDWVLYILFVQGRFRATSIRPLHKLHCNQKLCYETRPADFDPWPTCLARYELQGALTRFTHDPPRSRQLRLYLKKIKAAIENLEVELSRPECAALRDELNADKRLSRVTACWPLASLGSALISQAIVDYFGEAWCVYSLRAGPTDRIWRIAERYTYIESGKGKSWDNVLTRYEQFSYRFWILLAACYTGNVSLFIRFASSVRSRRRRAAHRVVELLYLDLLTVAAKNGHVDLVKYLVSIQDRASAGGASGLYHLVLRAALHSGRLEVVDAVLKLPQMHLSIVPAFTSGHVSCLLACDQQSRTAMMNLIDEHWPHTPLDMCLKVMEGAYSLGDAHLLNKYMSKEGHELQSGFSTPGIHGPAHEGHLECVRVTSVNPSPDHQYPMLIHTTLAKQLLIRNRLDLFLKLDEYMGNHLSSTVFPWLAYADGAEVLMIEILNKIDRSSESAQHPSPELGTLPVELAASALRPRALALLLAAGARPYHTVQRFVVPYSVYVRNKEAFYKTKAVLERYNCCPLVLES